MNFIEFQKTFSKYLVFSIQDIRKMYPNFRGIQLDRWTQKGYLIRIKRGFYCFKNLDISQEFMFLVANNMVSPSYISLEMALKFYNLIPEEIFQITSVTTKKTSRFKTDLGHFKFNTIKPSLYWGFKLHKFQNRVILVAEPEKALLDYLYINPHLKTSDDFVELRLNTDELKVIIDQNKFMLYLQLFDNKSLTKRAKLFLTTVAHDIT